MQYSIKVKNEEVVRKILDILDNQKVDYVFWGGLAYTLHTNQEKTLNDIDILISLNDMKEEIIGLYENSIEFKYIPDWKSIVVEHNNQIIDLDPKEWYLKSQKFKEFYLFGRKIKVVGVKELARMYKVAIDKNSEKKEKYQKRYEELIKMIKTF